MAATKLKAFSSKRFALLKTQRGKRL